MKLTSYFNVFMNDIVNLNDTRLNQLDSSVEALKAVIRGSDWRPRIRRFVPQGSWAHKTIIKPIENKPFDADLLVLVDPIDNWTAKNYLMTLRAMFAGHPTYEDKVRRFSHCITIEYAGERKIDIAPCIVNREGITRQEVCNFETDEFELTEPETYTDWLVLRNNWATNNNLRKVTRLLKYLRDIKGNFSCPSVLFTTLLGEQISSSDSFNVTDFTDLPTALKTIVGRIDNRLQASPYKPTIYNPALNNENFADLISDLQYENLRNKISKYRGWIDDAYDEPDRDESIGKWRRVFGDKFAKGIAIEEAAKVSETARNIFEFKSLRTVNAISDLVALFVRFGREALPPNFDRLPHKKRPKWRALPSPLFTVIIHATQYASRDGAIIGEINSGDGPLGKNHWLKFRALTSVGSPVSQDYVVHWRVTNTDQEAKNANQLRGGFQRSSDATCHWESLLYRGVHTVEAFVVRKRDKILVTQSSPFYVVIE